jgi:hypothetical protein
MNRNKRKGKPHNCFICGKYGSITEQHHVRPIKYADFDITMRGVYKTNLVWLCPNHHALVHKWGKSKNYLEKFVLSSECLANDSERNEFFKITEATYNGLIDESREYDFTKDSVEATALAYLALGNKE